MIFEKKKIQIETLSEYLKEVREELELSLEEVGAKTGIKLKFLEGLESGDFLRLPPDVYVLGFLRQLASLYAIGSEALIEQYKKEKTIQEQISRQTRMSKAWKGKIPGKIVITPKSVSLLAAVLFIAVTLVYIIWQVASINKTPSLEILEPQDRQVIKGSFINIRGKTDPGMQVTVNEQNIFVDDKGEFKTQLGITAGPKELAVTARNKFDKSVTKAVTVVGENSMTPPDTKLQVKLEFTGEVQVRFVADDGPAEEGVFRDGESKLISGKKKITVSTTDAGATRASLNDQYLGPMGRPGEELENIPFFAESDNIKQ